MLGVHEVTGSKPVFLTISEKPRPLRPFRADRRRLSHIPRSIKSQPMRASVAIRATGSSAISRRPILARILPGQAWLVNVFLAQTDRAGQACEAPDASSILAEDTFSSDSSTDRAVGYGPANEGSSPSPNTISSRMSWVLARTSQGNPLARPFLVRTKSAPTRIRGGSWLAGSFQRRYVTRSTCCL